MAARNLVTKTVFFGVALLAVSLQFCSSSNADSSAKAPSAVFDTPVSIDNCKLAAEFSAEHYGVSMLVMVGGKIVFEDYPNGGSVNAFHELASGTKSFAGVAALAAQEDKLLKLDEKVSDTIEEWKPDRRRSEITIRQLLTLTSGIKGTVGRCPTYSAALRAEITAPPGKLFQYGAEPFQIFGELMRRKLQKSKETMRDYLKRRVLDPADVSVSRWRVGFDGMPMIPQGAQMTAREWAKFGEFIRLHGAHGGKQIIAASDIDLLFQSTRANPMYGLTWWLDRPVDPETKATIRMLSTATDLTEAGADVPRDLVMAAGAGKQRLYVVPSMNMVVVRQSNARQAIGKGVPDGYSDCEFLARLTTGRAGRYASSELIAAPGRQAGGRGRFREQLLKRFDANGDGKLSASERRSMMQQLRQLNGRGRGQPVVGPTGN